MKLLGLPLSNNDERKPKVPGVSMLLNKEVYIVCELVSVDVRTCHAFPVMLVLLENKNIEKNHAVMQKTCFHQISDPTV